ncbi:hypothetical protein [Azorhizophilus paspali]|uniref:ATPase F1/V1/A1 complex alpha/beta subunit nucleotide-binding domain-containing protein n=1 Tax=Azorhizophilus paspali TaxID=69963 RepID=A0ABV6SJK4_AZOPA
MHTVLVYGQMSELPGARWRVPSTALSIAEYFRDERRQNVLPLMDNVFRFVQAGAGVSSLLGRLPSRVGYQPTLADEVAALRERIVSVGGVAVTVIEAVYVPADDFTDPAVTALPPMSTAWWCCPAPWRRRACTGGRSHRLLLVAARPAGGGRVARRHRHRGAPDHWALP